MPEPVRAQRVQGVGDVLRAQQLPGVGEGRQPGAAGDLERAAEGGGVAAALVVRQAEAHHLAGPVPGVLRGEAGQGAGVVGVPGAAGGHDDGHADPLLGTGQAGLVEDDLQGRGDAPDVRGVAGRVHLDLEPVGALGGVVDGGLSHDAAHVRLGGDAGAGGVVEPLETEPPAFVGGAQARRPLVHQGGRQAHALLAGEVAQGVDPHRPREV
ncbi:hypothetical protein BJF82_06230 [Kytococcus sp. CUA-901]|nr:hypothetical protein BJF82_06230 [Kytococcus sp. CUA-901]